MTYLKRRFVMWVVILMIAALAYWMAIYITRPVGYREGALRVYETSAGNCIEMPNFNIVQDPQCFNDANPKYIVSPSWAAIQEVWLRDEGCTVVVRSLTYEHGSAQQEMRRWVSDLMEDRALLQEHMTVSGHPALKLSAPRTLYVFVVWDETKLLELQADGCADEKHKQCLEQLVGSIELR